MFKLEIKPSETLHTKFGTAKINNRGYYRLSTGKLLHRFIFEYFYGSIPDGCVIHHKDGKPINNCIMNLQLLTEKEHHSLHHKGAKRSEETKLKMSEARNTSGYYRVFKVKKPECKQGFSWIYSYYVDGKYKQIANVDICKLEQKVKQKGLKWKKVRVI